MKGVREITISLTPQNSNGNKRAFQIFPTFNNQYTELEIDAIFIIKK